MRPTAPATTAAPAARPQPTLAPTLAADHCTSPHRSPAAMAPLTFCRLRIWNAAVGVVQLVAGIAIVILTPTDDKSKLPWWVCCCGAAESGNSLACARCGSESCGAVMRCGVAW